MTATTLGMLVDEGKVEWDAPLRQYLPWFKLMDPAISEKITPRDIVTHRSGLPRHDLLEVEAAQEQLGRSQTAPAPADLAVDDLVIQGGRFPAHTADQADRLHAGVLQGS
jgi:CubicO group peptidase (beta-lactamase class C family)